MEYYVPGPNFHLSAGRLAIPRRFEFNYSEVQLNVVSRCPILRKQEMLTPLHGYVTGKA